MQGLQARSSGAFLPVSTNCPTRPHAASFRCVRPQPIRLPTRQAPQRVQRTFQGVQGNAVESTNHYKFSHSVSENSFEVKGDINKIFEYAADFSHIDKWDSGKYSSFRLPDPESHFQVGFDFSLGVLLNLLNLFCRHD